MICCDAEETTTTILRQLHEGSLNIASQLAEMISLREVIRTCVIASFTYKKNELQEHPQLIELIY